MLYILCRKSNMCTICITRKCSVSIQLFVPKFRIDECLSEIRECLEKGWTGLGFKTNAFEKSWLEYTGLTHAHFLSSNTVGLHLAIEIFKRKYGWEDGDEVITTPLTFVSTNHAILYSKLKPVFADIDDHLCLDPKNVATKITNKTKALIYVGLGGNTGQYSEIIKLCHQHNIKLILDAAHMAGTRFHGVHVGQEADASVFSFQAIKNLPTADSGMVCFKDVEDDERVRKLTWLGINKDTFARTASQGNYKWMYDVEELGYKYHGNSIMASIALVQLKYLDEDNAYRRAIASQYRKNFSGFHPIRLIEIADGCESSTHLFQIRVKNRNNLMQKLNESNIFPGVHYRDNTEYKMYHYAVGHCPNAMKASGEIISLPLHLHLTTKEVDYISEKVIEFAI